MKLSILIPTLVGREDLFNNLMSILNPQLTSEVEVLIEKDNREMTIGEKRNKLLHRANGEYVCFVDCDDEVSKDYIEKILKAIESKPDCCSLRGVITWNGERPEVFEHSLKYCEWKTNDTGYPKYERCINHLNVVKSSIAKQFKFPEINHGEDRIWSEAIQLSGLLKTESFIDSTLYHYKFIQNK